MKYRIELVRSVDYLIEAPNEEAANIAANEAAEDELTWLGALEEVFVSEYGGRRKADWKVDEDGNEID